VIAVARSAARLDLGLSWQRLNYPAGWLCRIPAASSWPLPWLPLSGQRGRRFTPSPGWCLSVGALVAVTRRRGIRRLVSGSISLVPPSGWLCRAADTRCHPPYRFSECCCGAASVEGIVVVVVVGIDAHKSSHTLVAVDGNGRKLAVKTVTATDAGHSSALRWARLKFEASARQPAESYLTTAEATSSRAWLTSSQHRWRRRLLPPPITSD
jgi:hypothetical protein